MFKSLDLLKKLRRHFPKKAERAIALDMGYSDTAFQSAKSRGSLSAEMSADIATVIGENPALWALVAASERAKTPAMRDRLKSALGRMQKGRLKETRRPRSSNP